MNHFPDADMSDDDLMTLLAVGQDRHQPVPAGLSDRIKFSATVAMLEADVAELLAESELVGVRSGDDADVSLSFTSGELDVLVKHGVDAEGEIVVRGWSTWPRCRVDVVCDNQPLRATADDTGEFSARGVPAGQVYLVITSADAGAAGPVVTPPFVVG